MSDLAVARREALPKDTEFSTRANYDRACLLIARRGRIPGLKLSHRDIRVLQFLLGQKPGYFAHHKTFAEALDSSTTPIREALGALRGAGLVLWELIPPHHVLPTGNYTRTNVNRYWVNVSHILSLLGSVDEVQARPPKSGTSTPPKSGASTGKDLRSEQSPPSTPPRNEQSTSEPRLSGEEAVSSKDLKPEPAPDHLRVHETSNRIALGRSPRKAGLKPPRPPETGRDEHPELAAPAELEPILAAWRELKLGEPDGRSTRALVNRLNEGATLEQLEAAVVGADADEWLRRGYAKVPFAVVFATVASVERFAHEGRKIRDARGCKLRRERETRSEIRDYVKPHIDTRCQPPAEVVALCKSLFQPVPVTCKPSTGAQVAKRSAEEERERLQAWSRENGNV